MKESYIQKQIMDWLRWQGVFCWKSNTTGVYDPTRQMFRTNHYKGVADIIGVLGSKFKRKGTIIAVEVKAATGRVSPHQEAFLSGINECGGIAFVARSVEDVEKQFKAISN